MRRLAGMGLQAGLVVVMLLALGGCKSAYYGTWEKLGYHKRDILVERVEEAQESQQDAKKEFKDALEKFRSVVNVQDTKLNDMQARYDKFKGTLDACETRATDVAKRIDSVESVAKDLFAEWEKEIGQYTNKELARRSEEQLRKTQARYSQMIGAMEKAEAKMQPVLVVFRDQVLFLKHNLNARAVASLQVVVSDLERDTAKLIADMEKSIAEADEFIKEMGQVE